MSSVKIPPVKPARRKHSFPSSTPTDSVLNLRASSTTLIATSPPPPQTFPRPTSNPTRYSPLLEDGSSSPFAEFSQPPPGGVLHKISAIAREKGSKLKDINISQKKAELNAVVAERLPEWKSKGAELGNIAKETGMVWGKKGWEAVDKWKKTRQGDMSPESPPWQTSNPSSPNYLGDFGGGTDDQIHIFGAPLQLAVDLTRLSDGDYVPAVICRCLEYLDVAGMEEVGLYRIPGSTTAVTKLKNVFDNASDIDFRGSHEDPHAVATLLKMYMRELPESIVPDPLAAEFATLVSTLGQSLPTSPSSLPQQPILSPSFIASAALLTHRLPPANFHLLKALCAHLARIDANSLINKMNISNLGVIFCPTLGVSSVLFRCFVTENTAVFGNGPPVILDNLGCAITTSDDLARSKSPSVGIVGGKVAAISAVANARNHTQVSESSAKSLPSSFRGRGNSIGASPFHRFEDQDPVVATSPASLSAPKRTPVSARSSPTKGYFNTDHTSGSGSQLVSSTSTSSSSTNTTSSSSSVSASSGSLSSHASVGSLTSPNLPSSTANPTTTSTTNGLLAIDLIDKQTGSRNLAVLNVALREDQDRVRRARPRGMSASEEPDRWRREMIREREARAKAKEEAGVTTGMSGPVRSLARARAASAAAAGTMTTGA